MEFDCFAISECGTQREINEDFALMDPEVGVFVVADGVSGRPAGDRASRLAVETFVRALRCEWKSHRSDESVLRAAVQRANEEIRLLATSDPMLTGLGTTLSALVIQDTRAKVVHVGDSRIYCFHQEYLERLTKDHTLAAELEGKTTSGLIAARFQNVLLRAVGFEETVVADIRDIPISQGDIFILSTDGLEKSIGEKALAKLITASAGQSAREICEGVMRAAMAHPGDDNITVGVVIAGRGA